MQDLRDNFDFKNNNILSMQGNDTENFRPIFEYIEKYCLENCATTKWVEDMLVVYVANYNKIDYKKCDISEYYVQFLFAIYNDDSTEDDQEYSSVYFGDDVDKINSFSDLNDALDKIINKNIDFSHYKKSEFAVQKEPEFSQEDFQAELQNLRISEYEFLNILKIYNSLQ